MRRRRLCVRLWLAVAMASALPAHADTHALLVGVARVQALPPRLALRGPDHDVALMRQVLTERGVPATRITTLSRAPGDTPPTHDATHAALQALLQRAAPGDLVLLHLAGHAVQVPQRTDSPPEADALDEVFLLQDTGPWDAATRQLPRALYDHDIGRWMATLGARGVRVLGIFDACHAAGLGRASGTRWATARGLAATELGVPADAPRPPSATAKPSATGRATHPLPPAGALLWGLPATHTAGGGTAPVLAFAARSHESTPEAWLPAHAPDGRVHGVFSHAVARALAQGAADAAALRAAIARQYREARREQPVPMVLGEGPLGLP